MRQLPSDLSSKINQSLQTIGNNANPKMSIQVSRAKDTVMDSSYWTVETIRTKVGLGDLSIAAQRLNSFKNPTRLYNIYVDNGIVKTAIREYPDIKKEKWKTQFELGAGNAVATAFDGEWEFYRKRWQLKTYEKPFIFWVDSGSLWSQLWDETDTLFQLATEVTRVKAIRAWKNPLFIDKDQGIIAGYIKADGLVYYRGWCAQIYGEPAWEIERQLLEFTGIAVNLNLFITNDYRMGFIIEDNLGNITTFITNRNWSGMAIPPEKLAVGLNTNFEVIPTTHHTSLEEIQLTAGLTDIFFNMIDPIYPTILNVYNEDMLSFSVKCSHELANDLYNVAGAFKLKDASNNYLEILYTEPGEDLTIVKIFTSDFSHINGLMYLEYDSTVLPIYTLYKRSSFAISTTIFEFEPEIIIDLTDKDVIYTKLVPIFNVINTLHTPMYSTDYMDIGLTPTFDTTQVYHKYRYTDDTIDISIGASFIVTKVGTNPL